MPTNHRASVIHLLHAGRPAARPTDGELLGRFVARRDETAFAELLHRHGPMVLGACRRLLRHEQDAEDAFQAAFLVLARRAAAVVPREAVGGWLYGVACRTALAARGRRARRAARERQVTDMPERADGIAARSAWEELVPLLDEELGRLPEKYRLPVVLCELEGRKRREVARQLGLPEGTLSSRLASARRLLARRLGRRGLALPGGALAAALAEGAAAARVPPALAVSTVKAAGGLAAGSAAAAGLVSPGAAALTEGVLKAMFLGKLKLATGLLCWSRGSSRGPVPWAARPSPAIPQEPPQLQPGAAVPPRCRRRLRAAQVPPQPRRRRPVARARHLRASRRARGCPGRRGPGPHLLARRRPPPRASRRLVRAAPRLGA